MHLIRIFVLFILGIRVFFSFIVANYKMILLARSPWQSIRSIFGRNQNCKKAEKKTVFSREKFDFVSIHLFHFIRNKDEKKFTKIADEKIFLYSK